MGFDVGDLKKELIEAFKSGQIELPSMPELLFRIRKALYSGKSSVTIGKLLNLDSALATHLIQIANSPRYMGLRSVENPQAAVTRLGMDATRNIVTSIVLRNAYKSKKSPHIQALVKQAWNQSCRVGAISNVLASLAPDVRPDQAMLAGLLHNVGVLPMLNYLQKRPELMEDKVAITHVIRTLQGRLGTMLLKHWKFDSEFIDIPEKSRDLNYTSDGDNLNLIDIVVVARMHMMLKGEKREEMVEKLLQIPSFQKMNVSRLGTDASFEILEQAEDEISSLINTLQ